jgi:hypothetical protein
MFVKNESGTKTSEWTVRSTYGMLARTGAPAIIIFAAASR